VSGRDTGNGPETNVKKQGRYLVKEDFLAATYECSCVSFLSIAKSFENSFDLFKNFLIENTWLIEAFQLFFTFLCFFSSPCAKRSK